MTEIVAIILVTAVLLAVIVIAWGERKGEP